MRLNWPLRAVLLACHITGTVSWFAFLAGQLVLPWIPFEGLLLGAASIALPTGVLLAMTSPLGFVRYWWLSAKLAGSLAVGGLGAWAVHTGRALPYSRPAGLAVLGLCIWLSVARPWGKTPYGQGFTSKPLGRHTRS